MATTTARPWEVASSSPRPQGQLPSISTLTHGLPDGASGLSSPVSTRERDSGAWSQPPSTRSSTFSTNTSSYPMSSATNSYYMSPNRASNLSNTSGHGPTSHTSADYGHHKHGAPLPSPGFGRTSLQPSLEAHDPHRQSVTSQGSHLSEGGFPPQESRRSSLGSQVNQGLTSLQINGAPSPYQSVNHSSASLAQNLSRERGIPPVPLRGARSSAQLPTSPMSPGIDSRPLTGYARVAPPITHNPRSDVYNAADPVPGQAYAFPDAGDLEPGALPPKSARALHSSDGQRPPSHRRDSGHGSIASSATDASRMPPGQHRLDEAMSPHRLDEAMSTHHHSLMSDVQEDDAMTPEGDMDGDGSAQPYSRTPALRVSHKMAERKRRSEMKDLFENLRSQIPSNQGSKSSKWEILTKASEYIKQLEGMNQSGHQADKQLRIAMHDVELTRRDNEKLRNENQRLMQDLQRMVPASAQGPPPVAQQPGPPAPAQAQYPPHYAPPPPPSAMHDPARSLPPLTAPASQQANGGGNSMQGVQYTHEQR